MDAKGTVTGNARRRVADRPWIWAVAAAMAAAVMALVLVGLSLGDATAAAIAAELVLSGMFAVPLLLRRRPKVFAVVCLAVGGVTLPAAALIALMGGFLVLAPPVLLLVAAFADRSSAPAPAWVAVAFAASVPVANALLTL
ncbi:hypothetical protein ACFXB3_27345 [Streptomyces sp. NPDC059447]|uniref:hypothetical protein n=1 Tax=Streptomyces sp. NPDC059447 TaxID=3346834 RepID=UPI0036B34057